MIRKIGSNVKFMRGKLLYLVVCLALAGALMLPGTSFGAWVADSFNPTVTCIPGYNPALNACVHAFALQSNGQPIIAGYINSVNGTSVSYVARLNTNGTLDTSFMPIFDNSVDQVVVQANGDIIVGGTFTQVSQNAQSPTYTMLGIARFKSNGTLDTSFNPQLNNCNPNLS